MKVVKNRDLQIEDIRSQDHWNKLRIFIPELSHDLVNQLEVCTKISRYLNSRDQFLEILKSKKIKSNHEQCIESFNRLFLVENLPIYTIFKIKYLLPNSFLQIKDWKYINLKTPDFVKIPKEVCKDIGIRKQYEEIQLKQIRNFREQVKIYRVKFGPDTLSKLKIILPLGTQYNAVFSQDIDENIQLIKELDSSDMLIDNQLSEMLQLTYKDLIEFNIEYNRRDLIKNVLEYLKDISSEQNKQSNFDQEESLHVSYLIDTVEQLISNFEMLINPLGSNEELEFDYSDQKNIGEIIKASGCKNLGNIGFSDGVHTKGFLTIYNILDLLNLNSKMFIPFFHNIVDMDKELDRKNNQCYELPNEIELNLNDIYSDIKKWRKDSLEAMSIEVSNEYTRYLLPMCHKTLFNWYGGFNEILALSDSNFELKDKWFTHLLRLDPLFKK